MKSWLFSIIGVVFLSILFDLVYPNGTTNKFCKSMFGVISIFIIISPICSFFNIDMQSDYVDTSLVENLSKSKEEVLSYQIENYLLSKGVSNVNVEVDTIMSDNEFCVDNVYIDITNIVLTENTENINVYEVIINEVSEQFDINKERIFVYG
ncbi:MAG: hypothetical protein E7354_01375 [Clostridiales bacterium]|nr:hypothetical protein [Clostridiales bacterium]